MSWARALPAALITVILTFGGWTPVHATEARHWLRSGPSPAIVTVFDELHDAAWTRTLHASVKRWNAGIDNIELVFGLGAADCEKGHGPNTVVVCIKENANPAWRGQTSWFTHDNHLRQALVWIDTRHHPPNTRASLMCHEFGHVLGLEHRPDKDYGKTCMTASAGTDRPDRQDFVTVTVAHDHTHGS